jgi:hypothetical protein
MSSLLVALALCAASPAWAATVAAGSEEVAKPVTHAQVPASVEHPNAWASIGQIAASSVSVATEKRGPSAMVELPVPAALWLFGSGLAALGLSKRGGIGLWRRRRNAGDGKKADDKEKVARAGASSRKGKRRGALYVRRFDAAGRDWAIHPALRVKHILISSGIGGDGMEQRFANIATVFLEQSGVVIGRGFGRECVKFGKKAFLAIEPDHSGIAFRLGEDGAAHACRRWSGVELWNPMEARKPKHSWVICKSADGELLVQLAAAAYEYALASGWQALPADEDTQKVFPGGVATGRSSVRETDRSEQVAG